MNSFKTNVCFQKRKNIQKTKLQFDIGRNLDHSKKCTFVLEL